MAQSALPRWVRLDPFQWRTSDQLMLAIKLLLHNIPIPSENNSKPNPKQARQNFSDILLRTTNTFAAILTRDIGPVRYWVGQEQKLKDPKIWRLNFQRKEPQN